MKVMKQLKLSFYYGTMSSSKTANLLMMAHNYEDKGQEVFIMKPLIDNRSGKYVSSRVGISRPADYLIKNGDLDDFIFNIHNALANNKVILIDEVQFLPYFFIKEMSRILYSMDLDHDYDVLCFGLLTDMNGVLFEGSRGLIEEADKLIEVKTLCHYCSKKATKNYFLGEKDKNNNVSIGDDYYALCNYHFKKLSKVGG